MSPEVFDLDKLCEQFNISNEAVEASGFSKEDFEKIYQDYVDKTTALEQLKNDFLSKHIISAKGMSIHSFSGRVKDPNHLIEKIIRKKNNRDRKYSKMSTNDYYKYITDLIGCRILLVYKEDWKSIHQYLLSKFPCKEELFIDENDYVGSYDHHTNQNYIAEQPRVYIRSGDDETIYSGVPGITIDRKGYYRSVHYIIRYQEYYIELQVRSLFEEAWGEVDHDVLYPLYKGNKLLVNFSRLLNRTAGLGDEMSAYFKNHVANHAFEKSGSLFDTPYGEVSDKIADVVRTTRCNDSTKEATVNDILLGAIDES